MEFKYTAFTQDGKRKEGSIEAESQDRVADLLHEKGLTVVEVSEKSALGLGSLLDKNIGGVPVKQQVLFFRQMSFMLGSGLPLVKGLEVLSKQATNKALKKALKQATDDVRGGAQLYAAMKKHKDIFDNVAINLIKAGEESGNLDAVFDQLATDYERKESYMGKVRGAMIYPAIIMIGVIVVVIALLVFMVPAVKELFGEFGAEDQLPFATTLMINISEWVRGWGGLLLLFIAVFGGVGLRYYRSTKSGRKVIDGLILKIPVLGTLSQKSILAQFSRTFSMLLKSGVEILDAINLTAESLKNQVFTDALNESAHVVEKGGSLSKVLEKSEVFPEIVPEMVAVGEKTGKLDEIVAKMGEYFERESDQMATNLTSMLDPIIMIVVGLIVGFIALAVYSPIFSLGNVIK